MNCVHNDCEIEAKCGTNHCEGHTQKPGQAMKYDKLRKAKILNVARNILGTWSTSPPISQRTLVTATIQQISSLLYLKGQQDPTYDEVASVLRSAVDTGDLISTEKNDTTFYTLPEPTTRSSPMDDEQVIGRGDRRSSLIRTAEAIEPDVFTVDVDIHPNLQRLIDEMLATGLYGDGYDQFVREAICARVREYIKGKK